ncbi:HEAT repeat domain-containing protein [bacterium]|nr:HEAT repeat domain-containing protein [candidate division CSSED10-310 bacterium]
MNFHPSKHRITCVLLVNILQIAIIVVVSLGLITFGLIGPREAGGIAGGIGYYFLMSYSGLLIYLTVASIGLWKYKPFAVYMNLYVYSLIFFMKLGDLIQYAFHFGYSTPAGIDHILVVDSVIAIFTLRNSSMAIDVIILLISAFVITLLFKMNIVRKWSNHPAAILCIGLLVFLPGVQSVDNDPCSDIDIDRWIRELDNPSDTVQLDAVMNLGKCRSENVKNALLAKLPQPAASQDEINEDVLIALLGTLGNYHYPDVIYRLSLFTGRGDMNIRKAAIAALADIGDQHALIAIKHQLNDPDPEIKHFTEEAVATVEMNITVNRYRELLQSPDRQKRENAAWDLYKLPVEQCIDLAILALRDTESSVRRNAIVNLGKSKSMRAVEPLLEIIKTDNSVNRIAAGKALVAIGGEEAISGFIALLEHEDAEVRRIAAEHLRNYTVDRALDPLIDRLDDPSDDVRRFVIEALGNYRSPRVVEPISSQLHDPAVKATAFQALEKCIGKENTLPLIHKDASYPNPEIRRLALQLLANYQDPESFRIATNALKDENPGVRLAAATVLQYFGEKAIPYLEEALNDSSPTVKSYAQLSLKQIGTPKATDILTDIADKNRTKGIWGTFIQYFYLSLLAAIIMLVFHDTKPLSGAITLTILWIISTVGFMYAFISPYSGSFGSIFIRTYVLCISGGILMIWIPACIKWRYLPRKP